ncbi:MAG: penicillin-binding transpeptidase domain-containing protein [Myxococcales bacterium]
MSPRAWRLCSTVVATAVVSGSLIALAAPGNSGATPPAAAQSLAPALSTARPKAPVRGLDGLEPRSYRTRDDGTLVTDLPGERVAELTYDAALQSHLEDVFERYEVPYGAAVAIEPSTGRVLAYVSHSSANPDAGDLVRDPSPPAASVFKVVTGSALIDAGVGAGTKVCYSGGFRRLTMAHLSDENGRGGRCATLAEAMGGSINAIFARLSDRHLDAATLERYAQAFGFGHALPFDVPTRPSPFEIPRRDRLERARTAAGFWHSHMSPLHGALIAATIANDGVMQRPRLVDRVLSAKGEELERFEPEAFRSVIPRSTARVVGSMMQKTISQGTSHKAFHDLQGRPFLPGVDVAGKTGTLATERPYRAYNWWVGFAPADDPKIAVAALVVNTPKWRIKGSYVGKEALRQYLIR